MNNEYYERFLRNTSLSEVLEKVNAGDRLSFEDGLILYASNDINAIGYLANKVRERLLNTSNDQTHMKHITTPLEAI